MSETAFPPYCYRNGSGAVPRLPSAVVDALIEHAGVLRVALGLGHTLFDQSARVERLVHEACEELLARLPPERGAIPLTPPLEPA